MKKQPAGGNIVGGAPDRRRNGVGIHVPEIASV
jgi:hypothetical protein